MEKEKAIIIFRFQKKGIEKDLEIPLFITANEFVLALNTAFELGIDTSNVKNCYLKAENPIALIRGNKTLGELGIRNGTIINYTD